MNISIFDLIKTAHSQKITIEDINELQKRIAKFEEENKPLTFDGELLYNL